MAAMKGRDFAVVASSIRSLRIVVQTDLDRSYSDHGALVLDRLTEQLADDFAARYPGFNQAAFLNDTQNRQGFDRPDGMNDDDYEEVRNRALRLDAPPAGMLAALVEDRDR